MIDNQSSERHEKIAADWRYEKSRADKAEASNRALAQGHRFACERVVALEQELAESTARRIEQRSVELAVIQELTKRLESTPDTLSEANEHLRRDIEVVIKARDMAQRDLEHANRELKASEKASAGLFAKAAGLGVELKERDETIEQLRAINAAFDATNAELIEALGEARRDEHALRSELHAKDLQIARLESELRTELLKSGYRYSPQETGLAIGDTAPVGHEVEASSAIAQRAGRS